MYDNQVPDNILTVMNPAQSALCMLCAQVGMAQCFDGQDLTRIVFGVALYSWSS